MSLAEISDIVELAEVAQIAAHVAFYQDLVAVTLGAAPYLPIVSRQS